LNSAAPELTIWTTHLKNIKIKQVNKASPPVMGGEFNLDPNTAMEKLSTNHTVLANTTPQTPESMAALAGRMADDFNNILTTVLGACSLIDKDDPANRDLQQYVALIRASAEHAAALSVSLMRASTLEQDNTHSDSHTPDSATVDISVRDKKAPDSIVSSNNKPGGATS